MLHVDVMVLVVRLWCSGGGGNDDKPRMWLFGYERYT